MRRLHPTLRGLATTAAPARAEVVVIGGGIIGTSTAYHLAKRGVDVVLLEQAQLTAGTTWHAAGLMVTFGSMSSTSTWMRKYTKELYSTTLPAETGLETGFSPCGFIELASEPGRLEEYRRIAAHNRWQGVDVQEIPPERCAELFPAMQTDDVLAGFYVPDDGKVNPVDATMALAKGARQRGATIVEGCTVTGVATRDGRVAGVDTASHGHIEANAVVNCAGMWARQLAATSGVSVPLQAAEHYYLLTDPIAAVDPSWPVVEDPRRHAYIRPEGGGLMVGLFEPDAAPWGAALSRVPDAFAFGEIEPDWDRVMPFVETAASRVPAVAEAGVKKLFCGPESFTPDGAPLLGEAPEVRNYYVAAGLNSIGILSGGGIGAVMAQWITDGIPKEDVTGVNVDRFQQHQSAAAYRTPRAAETLGKVYSCHYPTTVPKTARGAKRSPLHDRMLAAGAVMRDVSGWEGAEWFEATAADAARAEAARDAGATFGRPACFDRWAAEHAAVRERVGLIDMSFMSKFHVSGPDAAALLNALSTADVASAPGRITYTQWLNANGKLEADVTVVRYDEAGAARDRPAFLVIATDTAHRHVEARMRRHIADAGLSASVHDVTGGTAQLNLQGPDARALLQRVTAADLGDAAFPFRTARTVEIGMALATVTRITYVGELGYEIFVPSEFATHVYDQLLEAAPCLAHVGLRALGSLRMEKGYRDYGHDMDNTDTLLEAGLGFTADYDKPGGFVGLDATLAQRHAGLAALPQRMLQVKLAEGAAAMLHHGEIVYRDGEPVGDIRAASFGHTLGAPVGLCMADAGTAGLTPRAVRESEWEVDVAGLRFPASASLRPMYDPKNERIKM